MKESNKISLFEGKEIRKVSIDNEWHFSVVDVIEILAETDDANNYWKVLKFRLLKEGSNESVTNCNQLKLESKKDGKKYLTDVADTETMLRIIQSIPSKNAEPFKLWLARIGKERLDEIEQPSKAIERGKGYYIAKGYSKEWVQTRTSSIDARHTFTDKLKENGIKESYQYAILTDELYRSSFGFTSAQYKSHKGLDKKDSLRDNMTPLELAATIFSEATSTELITKSGAKSFIETRKAIHIAGQITKDAIAKIEKQTGKKVVTHANAKALDSAEIRKELVQQALPEKKEIKEKKISLLGKGNFKIKTEFSLQEELKKAEEFKKKKS